MGSPPGAPFGAIFSVDLDSLKEAPRHLAPEHERLKWASSAPDTEVSTVLGRLTGGRAWLKARAVIPWQHLLEPELSLQCGAPCRWHAPAAWEEAVAGDDPAPTAREPLPGSCKHLPEKSWSRPELVEEQHCPVAPFGGSPWSAGNQAVQGVSGCRKERCASWPKASFAPWDIHELGCDGLGICSGGSIASVAPAAQPAPCCESSWDGAGMQRAQAAAMVEGRSEEAQQSVSASCLADGSCRCAGGTCCLAIGGRPRGSERTRLGECPNCWLHPFSPFFRATLADKQQPDAPLWCSEAESYGEAVDKCSWVGHSP